MSAAPEQPRHLTAVPEGTEAELARLAAQRQHHKDQAAQHEAAAAAIDDQIRRIHQHQGSTIHAGNKKVAELAPKYNAAKAACRLTGGDGA